MRDTALYLGARGISVYRGRVEDVMPDGEVSACVWKYPEGEPLIATIEPCWFENSPVAPRYGDSLRICAYFDAEGERRVDVEVGRRVLTVEEKAGLRALLEELRGGVDSQAPVCELESVPE